MDWVYNFPKACSLLAIMPDPVSVTFRDQITGRINDLLMDEHQADAASQNLLAYLAGALLNFQEEGIEFSPSVVLCDDLENFLRAFPGAVWHTVGTAPLDPGFGPTILKNCGPLSGRNWFIFIERTGGGNVNYGVFTYFRLPTAIALHEGITIDQNQFCVLVRKTSANTIEMRGAKGSLLTLIFSTTRESGDAAPPIQKFAAACCARVTDENISSDFRGYFGRLLDTALTTSHGTILVCAENLDPATVIELQDAVGVSPKLDFQASFLDFQTAKTAGSILALQRCEELLQGFFRCDGIVVFDTEGRVTAYRAFFRPSEGTAAPVNIVGGARRRAFEGVKRLVGNTLISALFRSQDGLTIYHGTET